MADIRLWRVDVSAHPIVLVDEVTECSLVLARSEREARALMVAVTGHAESDVRPSVAEWQRSDQEPPELPARIVGVWRPEDHVLAGYGIVPGEDWRECGGCGLVVHEDGWAEDGDECDACEGDGDLVSRQDEGADDLGEES